MQLLQGFRAQYDDPDLFYAMLADDTVALVQDYEPLAGSRVLDIGGGPGLLRPSIPPCRSRQYLRRAGFCSPHRTGAHSRIRRDR